MNTRQYYLTLLQDMTGAQRRAQVRKAIGKPLGQRNGQYGKFTVWDLRADDAAELVRLVAESRPIRGNDLDGIVEWFCQWDKFIGGHCFSRYYTYPDGWFAD